MKWSLKVGRIAGVDINIHWTFALLLIWIGIVEVGRGATLVATMLAFAFLITVFGCVVLHELGHALMARRFGVPTSDITLLPIGGVARLQRMPENPVQELWVAVAGPAVNVAIAGLLFIPLYLTGGMAPLSEIRIFGGAFLVQLFWVNVLLVAFNLIPAFPMDGGRVLRATLATRMDYMRATSIAANIGQVIAVLFGVVGLFVNPWLLFIAIFVYLGAEAERRFTQIKTAIEGLRVRDAMITRFRTLSPCDSLKTAADELMAGSQYDFPVLQDGAVCGVLRREDLARGLRGGGRDARVGDTMQAEYAAANVDELLEDVLPRLRDGRCSTVLALSDGHLDGLLTMQNIGQLIMLRASMSDRPETPDPKPQDGVANAA